jgi:predicted transcriptional regulator
MTMSDISKSLGYAESTMVNNHPGGLVELGILKRWKVGRVYHYQSNLEQHIQTTFPDLDWYDAAQRVIRAVQPEK